MEPRAAVLVGQPQELLALAQLGPGEVAREQLLEEAPDVSALAVALADQRVGVPARVGRELLGVVVVVRGALALAHGLVGLDALAVDVDAHELRIATHPHLLPHVASGNRVEALSELDVVVRVDFGLGPHGRVEAPGYERPQLRFLLVLEDDQGAPSGGAVRALAGNLDAPADGLALDMVAIEPRLAAEEALAQVLHVALDDGLSRGVANNGGVDDEAPVRGVLGEGALEDGIVAVGLGDRCLEIVEHGPGGHAAKEGPGLLEPCDQVRDLLGRRHVDVLVPAVDERDEKCVMDAPALGLGIPHETQPSEVDLGELAGCRLGPAHGQPPPVGEATVLDREAVKRALGNVDALAGEQLLDLGQSQPAVFLLGREPGLDLLSVG